MGLIEHAAAHTDQADLVVLSHVETYRDQVQPATPSAVAALIGGAPVDAVSQRLQRLAHMGLLDVTRDRRSFQLTALGCELLLRELVNWSPSEREVRRRDTELLSSFIGSPRRD